VKPIVEEHAGIAVVRDDLFPGGTKARFIPQLFDGADEVVYASPAQGGAQYALAYVAQQLGKRCTLFVANRATPHDRQYEAKRMGAKVVLVDPGYLTVVQKRASQYCEATGARLAPFGMDLPAAIDVISQAAISLGVEPFEVWCSAGSGTLMRSLIKAWPDARHVAVAVGRDIPPEDVGGAQVIRYPRPFEAHAKSLPPFPSCPHYDAKAWEICNVRRSRDGLVLFWNVTGPAQKNI
jgi:hypothetical protein